MSAIHLINRLPSRTIGLKSQMDILEEIFPKVRLHYGLALQIFGCVSYVHLHNLHLDKLSPEALKCAFVGYSNTQKGYKCYHPLNQKVFVTKDVTFVKGRFFYPLNTNYRLETDEQRQEVPVTCHNSRQLNMKE